MFLIFSPPYAPAGGAAGAVPSMLVKLLDGQGQALPKSLNVPPVALVDTTVEYLVLVRMPQAVTGAQQRLVRGYWAVPVPMVTTTGALMVVVSGMAWATTIGIST